VYKGDGGVYEIINLPYKGIYGNDNMMFQDLNNDVIANDIENWIQNNIKFGGLNKNLGLRICVFFGIYIKKRCWIVKM